MKSEMMNYRLSLRARDHDIVNPARLCESTRSKLEGPSAELTHHDWSNLCQAVYDEYKSAHGSR